MSKGSLNWEIQPRPSSVCILPLCRIRTNLSELPTRVSRALLHTKDKTGYIFTRSSEETLSVKHLRLRKTGSPVRTSVPSVSSRNLFRLTPGTSPTENVFQRTSSTRSSVSTLIMSETTESQSGSVSLVPGVFQSKKPKPRIILRYRQLSAEERVIQWLYQSCTRPSKTLPLL